MADKFTYKKREYRVDGDGNIYEDKVFGSKVGKRDKEGNFTIETGVFSKEEGRISKSGDVYEKGFFGGDKEKVGEKKDSCLLSSACVAARGLPDDCYELATLRKFRRDHLEGTTRGNMILKEYQTISGQILRWIEGHSDRKFLYDDLYRRLVRGTVELINIEQIEAAINHYQAIVREYQKRAVTSLDTINTIT